MSTQTRVKARRVVRAGDDEVALYWSLQETGDSDDDTNPTATIPVIQPTTEGQGGT